MDTDALKQQVIDAITSGKIQATTINIGDRIEHMHMHRIDKVEAGGVGFQFITNGDDRPAEDIQAEEVKPQPQDNDQELFKYIHPAITDDAERLRVHREVVNLVKNYPMVDICKHLMQMKKDERVYLGIKPALMFEELHRVGMPGENVQGYSYPNFVNYFNVK